MSPAPAAIVARAPGKIMLLGEYVVLEGAPALVAAVDRMAEVAARPAPSFTLVAPGLPWGTLPFTLDDAGEASFPPSAPPAAALAVVRSALAAAVAWARAKGVHPQPLALQVDTRAFYRADGGGKVGLGSSAATTVALLAALAAAWGLMAAAALATDAGRRELFARADAAHRRAQGGLGSGADVAAAVFGGVLRFDRPRREGADAVVRPLPGAPPVGWTVVAVGQPASTTALLAQVVALKGRDPTRYWSALERLGIAAQAGAEFWALGDGAAFVSVVASFQAGLAALGEAADADIVTAEHARLEALVRDRDGAYKISGAGGGDLGVAFACSPRRAARLVRPIVRAGFCSLALGAPAAGVVVEESR